MKFFNLLERENVHIAPGKKIIPAQEFSQLITAGELLEKTKEEEEKYRKAVAKECEQLKADAEAAGFAFGLQKLNNSIASLDEEIKSIRHEMENSIVSVALTAVKKIIGRELQSEPKTMVDIIATALKAVTQHRKINIFVNPADYQVVENSRPRLKELFEYLDSLTITPREDIEEGGCIIETEAGIINAQLQSQLAALETAFYAFFQSKSGE